MGFSDVFSGALLVEPAKVVEDEATEHVNRVFKDRIAAHLQRKLRQHIEPGLGGAQAIQSQMIQVRNKEGRLVVQNQDQAEPIMTDRTTRLKANVETIDDLYQQSLEEVPRPYVDSYGKEQLAFRVVDEKSLFGTTHRDDEVLDKAMNEVLEESGVDAFEEAVQSASHTLVK